MLNDDRDFLGAIHDNFDDLSLRGVYADWLDDRGDPRGEFLRLEERLRTASLEYPDILALRDRWFEIRAQLDVNWLYLVGSYRATPDQMRPLSDSPAQLGLDRPFSHVDGAEYLCTITAAAENRLSHLLAYVESRERQIRADFRDVHFHLHVRGPSGGCVSWELESYNPYFGCRVTFLEWFGDTVVLIYREKHRTYVCRFGLSYPARYVEIEDRWLLDGPQIVFWEWRGNTLRRLSIPGLQPLSALSESTAARWELLPKKSW